MVEPARAPAAPLLAAPSPQVTGREPETVEAFLAAVAIELWPAASPHPPTVRSADLARMLPGTGLASEVARLEPADVDDATLIEAIAGCERLASWAAERQARAIGELRRRRAAQRRDRFVGDEVAACLSTTRTSGELKVGLSMQLDRLPAVADSLHRGEIDLRRATVLTDEVAHLPDRTAEDVADAVLGDAPTMTAPQLRARLRRMEVRRDPGGAAVRHERSRADRHVVLAPTHDSMAWLSAYLPADDAVAVHTTLTALADAAPADDTRPVGARRADALVDLATRYLDSGATPEGTLPSRHGRHPHLHVTASATSLLALDDEPAELAGYGPVPAAMARRIAERATWRPLLVDARSGALTARGARSYRPPPALAAAVVDRDGTCRFPGCRTAAVRCDLDHVRPFDPARPAAGQTTAENLQALCRHHHRLKTHGGWAVERDPVTGSTTWRTPTGHVHVRAPDSALLDTVHREPRPGPEPPPPPPSEARAEPPPPF